MRSAVMILVLLATPAVVLAAQVDQQENSANKVNPIRKVVTMLQKMEESIEAEGKKEEKLFEEYMCYCKNGEAMLGKSIADANVKIPQLGSDIEEAEGQKSQLAEDLKTHKADSEAAKAAIAQATANRNKEAAAYAAESDESTANIAALKKALVAIEKGVGGAFLQTGSAQVVRDIVNKNQNLYDDDRQAVLAFLSQSSDNAAPSDQIIGILKQMGDEMEKSAAEAGAAEKEAIANFEGLMAAKTKEVQANTDGVEKKTVRIGELGVEIVDMKEDLADTEESLAEDSKFLADLKSTCGTVGADYEARQKTRGEELLAIADTIKILNDDDALELFKKTLASAAGALLQVGNDEAHVKAMQALSHVRKAQQTKTGKGRPELDFMALALSGKQVDFTKVANMIGDMIKLLKEEQVDDDNKKEYCSTQLDVTEDKVKQLAKNVEDLEASISESTEIMSSYADEAKELQKGVAALDRSVAEATEQRKEENKEYQELITADSAAVELLGLAKNRLNKFYNPSQYQAPAVATGPAFVQVFRHQQHRRDEPGAPPATWGAFYSKKSEESVGVIGMIDQLIGDVKKEMHEAKLNEEYAQKEYEDLLGDSAKKRATDLKSIATKEKARSDAEEEKAAASTTHATEKKQLQATRMYEMQVHGECDWFVSVFDLKKTARAEELAHLQSAEAALRGAEVSMLQASPRHSGK
eukprot:gnl/TRDRNA2_/TRDRNA2_177587_c2_seq2.p1 gnl/TRDRNA2_/TRDRNA2_177587_c2~~gnl/TRDRNA2_/TRDRNA2_177587_c2_seq2.p1  ORF type:complete len:698 (+),score=255.60 gnl/TRDRNA2_/TRDRNA2_177587_c2_seq2:66-2159(+)